MVISPHDWNSWEIINFLINWMQYNQEIDAIPESPVKN